ncbi:MAG: PQQ-binding-like beta-propeller repeat protein [Candidatus Woesearchaeota archaeon]|nr:MAG: PQQ-binding-like beta-propeller repeat protein [Candidatus Woesearchaeota archaeon]
MKRKILFFSSSKSVSPLITTILLLAMTVLIVLAFQTWFQSFSSTNLTQIESASKNAYVPEIMTLSGKELYLKNLASNNMTISKIFIDKKLCQTNVELLPNVSQIDVRLCLEGLTADKVEVEIVSQQGIASKEFFYKGSSTLMPHLIWNITYGTSGTDYGFEIHVNKNHEVYILGTGNSDFFLAKFDSNGQYMWNVSYDYGTWDGVYGSYLDKDGNLFATGGLSNSFPDSKAFTAKFDSNGNELWNISYAPPQGSYGQGVVVDSQGNVYVLGGEKSSYFYATLFKYDSSGNELWNKSFDDGNESSVWALGIDSFDNVYYTGEKENFDKFYTAKYDSEGNPVWNITIDGVGNDDWGYDLVLDSENNLYVGGTTNYNYLLLKYDSDGNELWNISGNDHFYVTGLDVDQLDNVYFVDANILEKYDKNGNPVWNTTFNSVDAWDVDIDTNGDVYVIGYRGTNPNYDFMILKYEQS